MLLNIIKVFVVCFFIVVNYSPFALASKHTEWVKVKLNEILTELESKETMQQKRQTLIDKYMPLINFEWNAKMALGRPYKDLIEQQQKEYIKEYTKFLAYTWLPKMNYDRSLNLKFVVNSKVEKIGKNDERVNIEITSPDSKKYNVFLRIRCIDEQKTCQILDLDIEGVELAMSYRAQFAGYIEEHSNDVSSVITFLKAQNKINKANADFKLPLD